jgi:hypothetical protein
VVQEELAAAAEAVASTNQDLRLQTVAIHSAVVVAVAADLRAAQLLPAVLIPETSAAEREELALIPMA